MLNSAEFFESFQEAGFLKPASWTPSAGGTPRTGNVRYRAGSVDVLNDAVRTTDHEITYVTAQFPGLKEGERIAVDGQLFQVRQKPTALLDGTVARADLVLVVVS